MGVFYLLHEYTERYYPNSSLGKKFARTAILGFIIYYMLYFIAPLYYVGYASRIQHFLRYLIVVDSLASSVFYGGMLNSISFWSTGKSLDRSVSLQDTPNATVCRVKQELKPAKCQIRSDPVNPKIQVSPWLQSSRQEPEITFDEEDDTGDDENGHDED
jgi:hypothetical protein